MSATVGDYLLDRLATWGVTRIYGYPGDGINGIMGAFTRSSNGNRRPEFIQSRHEEMAAFMACAHAKFTGELGVCMATSGPGAIHFAAQRTLRRQARPSAGRGDRRPTGACRPRRQLSAGGRPDDPVQDVAHEFAEIAMSPAQIRHLVDRACRIALADRASPRSSSRTTCRRRTRCPHPRTSTAPSTPALAIAGPASFPQTTTSTVRPRCWARVSGWRCSSAPVRCARAKRWHRSPSRLGAGVAKALLGKAVLPDHLPYVTGSIGLLGTKPSWDLMQNCDTPLMVGSSFPYSEFLPEEGQARGVQIDIDGRMIGIRYPMEVNLIGDSTETLRALIPRLEHRPDRSWRAEVENGVTEWWRLMDERAHLTADPMDPQLVFHELSSGCRTGRSSRPIPARPRTGTPVTSSSARGRWRRSPGRWRRWGRASRTRFGAKFAYPDRPVFALVGDGAMQMNGINELTTIAKYRDRWPDQRLIVLGLEQPRSQPVTLEQRAMSGDPKFEGSQDLPTSRTPRTRRCSDSGISGASVPIRSRPVGISPSARIDPSCTRRSPIRQVPPLPPHITIEQAKALSSALLSGDPNASQIVRQSMKQKLQEFLPGR